MAAVFLLDDSDDLLFLLKRLIFKRFGVESLSYAHASDVEEHLNEILECKLAILDINLGMNEPTGIDVYNFLRAHNFKGKIHFLTGHAQSHPLVKAASELGTEVFTKPLPSKRLFEIVAEALR